MSSVKIGKCAAGDGVTATVGRAYGACSGRLSLWVVCLQALPGSQSQLCRTAVLVQCLSSAHVADSSLSLMSSRFKRVQSDIKELS